MVQEGQVTVDGSVAPALVLPPLDVPGDMVRIERLELDPAQLFVEELHAVPLAPPGAVADLAVLLKVPPGKLAERQPPGIRPASKSLSQLSPRSIRFGDANLRVHLLGLSPVRKIAPEPRAIRPMLIHADPRFSVLILLNPDAHSSLSFPSGVRFRSVDAIGLPPPRYSGNDSRPPDME